MHYTTKIGGIFLLFLLLSTHALFAQKDDDGKEKKEKHFKGVALDTKDTTKFKTARVSEYQFPFYNIHKVPYYRDDKLLSKIEKLDKKGDFEELLPLLEEYVKNFGIRNFYKDTHLLWRLGQLYELRGMDLQAKTIFRLVLKHHDRMISEQIKHYYAQHYDSLTVLDKDYFVPLKYYYELVEYRKEVDTLRPPKSILESMGDLVNSKKNDYGPTLSKDNRYMIFTSHRNEVVTLMEKRFNEDLYISINYDGFWDEAFPLKDINSRYNEGSACLSKDGKTLYFTRCGAPDGFGNCDIYVAKLQEDSTWGQVKNLGHNVNSVMWDSQPTLSHTEDTLYFSSARIGGFGLEDIYMTYKTDKGNWAPAKNLGPIVNTRGKDVSPFYHPKYKVLYFSSDGHIGRFLTYSGSFDIYRTYKIEGKWQEPKNIGPLVNGKGPEQYFTIDSESQDLFYAHAEEENINNLDLYSFPLPMGAQPLATTRLHGKLVDSETGAPFKGIVSIIDLDNGIEVAPKFVRPDGTYDFDLIDDNRYLMVIQGDDFFRIESMFTMHGDTTIETRARSLKLEFESIEFENGKADILEEMQKDLNDVVNFMLDHPTYKLKISGHTDSDGAHEANLKLSQDRANSIKQYLIEHFVDGDRVEAVGYGDTKPIRKPEVTEEDKAINRRVEFNIIKPEGEEEKEIEDIFKDEYGFDPDEATEGWEEEEGK